MIDKIIMKLLGHEFISRKLISDAVVRAQESEAKRINKIRDDEERRIIDNMRLEHEIELAEAKAETARLEKIIDDYQKKWAEVDAQYYQNKKDAKRNVLITAEMEHKGQALIKNIGEFIGGIKGVGNAAQQHLIKMEDKK